MASPFGTLPSSISNAPTFVPSQQTVNNALATATPQASWATNNDDAKGRRVRLRPKPAGVQQILGSSPILNPLKSTNGMVWPYQPTIQYSQEVDYQSVEMVHVNQEYYAYKKTNAVKLTCEGEFTVQNQAEGQYAMACIHFLRTVTKMYFGQAANLTMLGTPPPVLLFEAFGTYMFNKLPVIITNFSSNMPKEVDYVPIDIGNSSVFNLPFPTRPPSMNSGLRGGGNYVWLPAVFSISVALTVQNTPARARTFNLDQFRNGSLLQGGGWI